MKENKNPNTIKVVALVTALSLLGDSMLYIALPIYWEQAGLESLWQVGVLLSINRFVRLPVAPFVGWLYKRISLKTGLIIATLLGAFTTLGYGLFSGFIAWVILRSLWGVAWSFFRIGGLASVSVYSKKDELGKSMGTYNGLHRLGSLFGMLLGGIFVPIIGLKAVAVTFGILTLCGLFIILIYMERDSGKAVTAGPMPGISFTAAETVHVRNKLLLVCITGFFMTMLIQGVLASTLSSVIESSRGEFVSLFQVVVSAAFLSGLLQSCRWLWEPFLARQIGIWSDGRIGRVPLFICSLVFTGVLYGLIAFDLPIIFWIAITLLVMAGATVMTTLNDAIAIDDEKTSMNFLTGYTIIQDVGASIGPFVSFMIIGMEYGFSYLYIGGSVILLLLAFFWTLFHLKENAQFRNQA
ncbi:MFS transporter [Salinicoccus halitifaciens]|uniref:MFS family permease n=1 Tax=Salinicoccus halitifaciens TaxID=1073415 RepID=A0ABV2E8Q9_9STAP|nr:MFS transporter [Salinicoccus halitifaciens]MCD2137925.1 MFS transporter [Salinicoccus halitifaciens]